MKKKFKREIMRDILDGGDGEVILNEIADLGRWSVHYELTFKYEDKIWFAHYSIGATEQQDESPWEYEDEVECLEVRPVEKIVTVYEPVKD